MSLFRRLQQYFSPRLALVFLAVGVVTGLLVHFLSSDYDHRGYVWSADDLPLRLVFETQGQGPPLVALAGGPGISHHAFHPYLGHLGAQAKVIYFDPRGRGDSDPASTYTVADDVRDLESLREGLRLDRLDLLGVSYGAHLALCYALEHPQAVRKLLSDLL